MKKWLIVLLVVLFASQCFAFLGRPDKAKNGEGPDSQKMFKRICEKLELTEKQKAQLQADNVKREAAMKVERIEMKTLAEQMKAEMKKENPDRKKIHKYIRQINHLRMLAQIRRTDSLLDLRQMLTPKQKEKFKQMMQRRSRGIMKPGDKR